MARGVGVVPGTEKALARTRRGRLKRAAVGAYRFARPTLVLHGIRVPDIRESLPLAMATERDASGWRKWLKWQILRVRSGWLTLEARLVGR